MTPLEAVEVGPADAARGVVIWLHGLGADGHDFEPLVPHLGLDGVRFVFPHAPFRPVTCNGGWVMRAWYDIRHLHAGPDREDPDDIRAAAVQIDALIRRERARGVAPERVVLAGFSQGGAMALHVGLRQPERLAGVLALSTYLVLPETLTAEAHPANAVTPVFCAHGTRDDVVPLARGRAAFDAIAPGRDARWRTWPVGHGLHDDEIVEIRAWLHAVLA